MSLRLLSPGLRRTMFHNTTPLRSLTALAIAAGLPAFAQSRTYTTTADFEEGVRLNVNALAPGADQLQLDAVGGTAPLPFLNVPATLRGTIVRIDVNTGTVIGEYRTAPDGIERGPSVTAVDSRGNVWVANRDPNAIGNGSVVKIGIVIGGTRVDANGMPNATGEYLAPPFLYNTCIDRDGDGLIRTSRGSGDILAWPDVSDGAGGADGLVEDALDECILVFQRTGGPEPRHVSVDAQDDVLVGSYPFFPVGFDRLDGDTGALLASFPAPGCGGHGGVESPSGVLWSTSLIENALLRRDLTTNVSQCIPVDSCFGIALGADGAVWCSQFAPGTIVKLDAAGVVQPGFPKSTFGAGQDRSVAITPLDGHVWVANSAGSDVSRLDPNGDLVVVVPLGADGLTPTGLAVDANGKVWAVCRDSSTAKRIDPATNAVDMTIDLGVSAGPTALTDMTGQVPLALFANQGSWTVLFDAGAPDRVFGTITTNEMTPAGTSIATFVRVAAEQTDLAAAPFLQVQSGVPFGPIVGRYAEIRVDFLRDDPSGPSPLLFDLTIATEAPPMPLVDCRTGRRPGSLLVFPECDTRPGRLTLLTITNLGEEKDPEIDVEIVFRGRFGAAGQDLACEEFNATIPFTPNDTFTFLAGLVNAQQELGFAYAFARDRQSGEAVVHDRLQGQQMLVDAILAADWSINAYSFRGVGEPGTPTDLDGDGLRDLNDIEYSGTPDVLLFPRFLGQGPGRTSELVLLNLTGGLQFEAGANFLLFNDDEQMFSAELFFRCWTKLPLVAITDQFSQTALAMVANDPEEIVGAPGLESGWFTVDGAVAISTAVTLEDPALLGFLIENVRGSWAADLPFERGCQTNGDLYAETILGDLGD